MKGFQFDINSVYEAQVVLNYGTGVEIRSERRTIVISKSYIPVTLGLTKQLRTDIDPMAADLLKITAGDPSPLTLDWGLDEREIKYYYNGRIEGNGLFRAIHLNQESCNDCVVTTTNGSRTGNMQMAVLRPEKLGNSNNQYDGLIIDAADTYGVPPQLIKAMIKQESNFNPNAGRYEPFYDAAYVNVNSSGTTDYSISSFWLQAGPTIYEYFNAHRTDYPMKDGVWHTSILAKYKDILQNQGETAAEHWLRNYFDFGITDSSEPETDAVPARAQTRIAKSYGLLQMMYLTALQRGFASNRPPEDLNDAQVSVNLGVGYFRAQFGDNGSWDEDWQSALLKYNGGKDLTYPPAVWNRINNYLPKPEY